MGRLERRDTRAPVRLIPLLATLLVFSGRAEGQAPAVASPSEVTTDREVARAAAAAITPELYRERIFALAHDSMRGRDTPSRELNQAAEYVAAHLRGLGLEPGGDHRTYLQWYPILRVGPDAAGTVLRSADGLEVSGPGALTFPMGAAGGEPREGGVVLLVGIDGAQAALEGRAVAGSHLVLVGPDGDAGAGADGIRPLVRGLRALGPASILVPTSRSDAAWTRAVALHEETTSNWLPWSAEAAPLVEIRDEAITSFLALHGVALADLRQEAANGGARVDEIPDLRLSLRPNHRVIEEDRAPNVVGVLPGRDPVLSREFVVFSAHLDHVGVGRPDASGDSIYNGADDNASGSTALLGIADAFAALPEAPRRSVAIVWVSGEERGLLGSRYFVDHGSIEPERMVANFNLDMVGRNWPDTIVAIGRDHSDLGGTLEAVNGRHPDLGMTAIDDLWPEQSFFTRSDHYNFARRGVPALFFFNGTHEDYHRPSDRPELIDAEKASRIARLVFKLGYEVAEREVRPEWNPASYERIVVPTR